MADFDATRQVMGETNSLSPREQDAWNRAAEMEARYDRLTVDYARKCDEIERLRAELESLAASVMNLSHPNCQLLLRERNEVRAKRDALLELLKEARERETRYVLPLYRDQNYLARIDAAIDAARSKP